jgi:uroporphyrinogen III methyltransferase/synthase
MTRPLASRRFLITRPENQSAHLAQLLREAGATPLLAPMIAIAPTEQQHELQAVLQRLGDFDLAVFVSPTALDVIGELVQPWPVELAVAVVGPASRERALALGMLEVISPDNQFDSEGLLQQPALQQLSGKRVVLFRGNGGRELLTDTLRARGATVEVVEAYRRLSPSLNHEQVLALLAEGCDGVIVTSSEAVNNLFGLADSVLAEQLRGLSFFASHAAIAETVRRHAVAQVHVLSAGDAGLLADLRAHFSASPASQSVSSSMPLATPIPSPAPSVAVLSQPADTAAATPAPTHHSISRPQRAWLGFLRRTLVLVLLTVGISALVYQFQARALHGELQTRLAALEGQQSRLNNSGQREGEQLRQLEAALAASQQRVEALRAQQSELLALYGAVAGGHEETLLADAELTLSLASQQLQLTGNVGAALAALYRLDERLSGHDKPRLMPLRRAVARDIDVLKSMPWIDYVGLSARLDSLATQVDKLPLVVDGRARDAAARPETQRSGLLGEIGRALGALVEIRRIDQPNPVLLAPEQAFYLREHLKLRLLNARLALLQRDEVTFRQDLSVAQVVLREQFDTRSKPVKAMLAALAEAQTARPAQTLPSLVDSLNAARDARRKVSREDSK